MSIISIHGLSKGFSPHKGSYNFLSRFLRREARSNLEFQEKLAYAVSGLTFDIAPGERVAFIGPNGAGKSTTIKMLTGILHPTAGHATVAGLTPWKDRRALSHKIGCVFGQRSQLWYHLKAQDSFDLLRRMYGVSEDEFRSRMKKFDEIFSVGALASKRVSELSLGERMKCEIVGSLIHQPQILLLDEPSIGLDVVARLALRDLIKEYSVQSGVTVVLTSHDTGDIEGVCDRVIMINHGTMVLDSTLSDLRRRYISHRVITVQTEEGDISSIVNEFNSSRLDSHRIRYLIPLESPIDSAISKILQIHKVRDISIEDPPLEEVISQLYRGQVSKEQQKRES